MIEFDIKTIKNRSQGKVKVTETHIRRNGKQYYDVEYTDNNVTHKSRVLHKYDDGVLTLISKATKAVERARRTFYTFPKEKVRWVAKRDDGVVCVAFEEDMSGNKSDSHGLMPVIMPADIPKRYCKFVMKWMIGQGCPVAFEGVTCIYLHDFNRWLKMQFVDTV